MKKRLIIAALAIIAMVGCQKEISDTVVSNSGDVVVKFSSASIDTRTTQISDENGGYLDAWEGGDRIGISTSGYISNGFNKEFSNVEHAATCEEPSKSTYFENLYDGELSLIKPNSMSSDITYYAYYPYTSNIDENDYILVDISSQDVTYDGNFNNVDFMVASTQISTPQDEVSFKFEHKLSKVIFEVSFNDEVYIHDQDAALKDLGAEIKALCSATYDIEGGFQYLNSTNYDTFYMGSNVDDKQASFTAILHPMASSSAKEIIFYLNDNQYKLSELNSLEFKTNTVYTYNVVLGRDEASIVGSSITDWVNTTGSDIEATKPGDGTRNNPYQISTEEDLLKIGTGNWYGDSHYILMKDITLSEEIAYDAEYYYSYLFSEFTNSDDAETSAIFSGTLNGNGNSIIIPDAVINSESVEQFALFAVVGENGKVYNLNINFDNASLSKSFNIYAIAYRNLGTIDSCSCLGNIINSDIDGSGLYIVRYNSSVVSNCSNSATISGGTNSTIDILPML